MLDSPRIAAFLAQYEDDAPRAVAVLRDDLAAARGPLLEGEVSAGVEQVTFVCIRAADRLSLASGLVPGSSADVPMLRAGDSDVWFLSLAVDVRVATTYQFRTDVLSDADASGYRTADEAWAIRVNSLVFESSLADEFNPLRMYPIPGAQGGDGGAPAPPERYASILRMPAADRFALVEQGHPSGSLQQRRIHGTVLPGDREVTVYLPPGYDPASTYPLVVMFDGEMALQIAELPKILDAGIASGRIPPVVVAFWHNLDVVSRLHELKCHPDLPAHLADELLPWLRSSYAVTKDPAKTVVCGFSLGGLSAAWVGLERPDDFGSVLAASPSLWWAPPPAEKRGWLTNRYRELPVAPLRIFLSVGSLETEDEVEGDLRWTMVEVAEELREVLLDKEYDLRGYDVVPGAHDFVNVRVAVISGLTALLVDSEES